MFGLCDSLREKSFGIIGTGEIGIPFALALARKGVEATIADLSYAALPKELQRLPAKPIEETATKDVVLIDLPWREIRKALRGLPTWDGRMVIDASRPIDALGRQINLLGRSSAERVAEMVPGAALVKAFGNMRWPARVGEDPSLHGGRRVVFYGCDDQFAAMEFQSLMTELGFRAAHLGPLAKCGELLEPCGALATDFFDCSTAYWSIRSRALQ